MKEFSSLPKITLKELINEVVSNKKGHSLRNSANIYKSMATCTDGVISVREPFYIDRFQRAGHNQCHQEGNCMACQYAKLKPFIMQKKRLLTKPAKQNCFKFVKTQRESKRSPQSKLEQIQQKMGFLKKYIKQQMKKVGKKLKQLFYSQTGRRCEDRQIIALCAQYLIGQGKNIGKQNRDEEYRKNLTQICNNIARFSIEKIITQPGFLIYVRQKADNPHNHKVIEAQRKRKRFSKQCSIRQIVPQDKEVKDLERKILEKRKGLIISEFDCMSQSLNTSAKTICSKLFIEDDLNLNDEVKERLQKIATRSHSQFQAALQAIYDFLRKMNQNGYSNQKMVQKLEVATQFIKQKIQQKDPKKLRKFQDLDNLVSLIRKLAETSNMKSSVKKSTNKIISSKKLVNKQQDKNDHFPSMKTSKIKHLKKQKVKMTESQSQKPSMDNTPHISRRSVVDIQQNNIQQQENEQVIKNSTTQFEKVSQVKSHNNSSKISENKVQLKRGTMMKQDLLSMVHPEVDFQKRRMSSKHNERLTHKQKGKQTPDLESYQQLIKKITQAEQSEGDHTFFLLQQDQKLLSIEQIERRNRAYLKKRAAQLLKQNQQLIKNGEKTLKNLNLNKYVINQNDCILTQKKKVRHLKQLLKFRIENGDVSEDLVNQILDYLSVYEENYYFLMQKSSNNQNSGSENSMNFNMEGMIKRKLVSKDLHFFCLNEDYIYGQAQQEQINFTLKAQKYDKSWQIMSIKNIDKMRANSIMKNKQIYQKKPEFDDIIQTGLPSMSHAFPFGIAKILQNSITDAYDFRKSETNKSVDKVLLTLNQ